MTNTENIDEIIENEMVIIRSISDVLVSVNSSDLNRDTIPTLATIMRESAEKMYDYIKNYQNQI